MKQFKKSLSMQEVFHVYKANTELKISEVIGKKEKDYSNGEFIKNCFELLTRRVFIEKKGAVKQWLKHRTDDQHGLGSKPTCAILLCPWKRHFTALFPCLVVLTSSSKLQ